MTRIDRLRSLTPAQRAYLAAQLDGFPETQLPLQVSAGPAEDGELVAFVVAKGPVAPSEEEVREWLRSKLPEFMVPARLAWIDSIPRNANGKADRHALVKRPASRGGQFEASSGPPTAAACSDPVVGKLSDIWREVLRADVIRETDNFFELGGHSLLVIQVLSRIRKHFGIELSMRTVFEAPTMGALAATIRERLQ